MVAEPQAVGLGLLQDPDVGLVGVVAVSHVEEVVVVAVVDRLMLHHLRHRGQLVHQARLGRSNLHQALLLLQVDELTNDARERDGVERV